MRIEEIQIMENDNNGVINLVRDRLFWRAWERSAYLFNMHIIPYKVQHKSYKQINKEMLFIGFPDTSLDKVKRISTGQHFDIHNVSEAHIIISGMPVTDGFTEWCAAIMKTQGGSQPKMRNISESRLAK